MMFWEILATVFSGFLFAGLVLPIRLFYKKTPKWIVPAAAGIGMICFQVYSEYTWFDDTKAKLPAGSVIVAEVSKSTWFRPWSYIKPQVFQFVVLDTANVSTNGTLKSANLYFFERRALAYPLGISVDCSVPKLEFDPKMNDAIVKALCQ